MIKHEKNSNSHVTANATGLLKLAMQESMMIPVLTRRSPSTEMDR